MPPRVGGVPASPSPDPHDAMPFPQEKKERRHHVPSTVDRTWGAVRHRIRAGWDRRSPSVGVVRVSAVCVVGCDWCPAWVDGYLLRSQLLWSQVFGGVGILLDWSEIGNVLSCGICHIEMLGLGLTCWVGVAIVVFVKETLEKVG